MFWRLIIAVSVWLLVGCGGGAGSDSGPLVDNTQWRQSIDGEEFFGTPPAAATCNPPQGDCPDLETGECVDLSQYPTCLVSYVAECFQSFTVLSVYTERCNWVTFEQPSLRAIRAGDEVEIRAFHSQLTAPFDSEARISLTLGDELIFDERLLIPQPSGPANGTWIATDDFEAGTPMLFHVNNHGNNEYLLIEVNICQNRPPGGGDDQVPCLP